MCFLLRFVLGDDLLEFHQAVVSTLRDADDAPIPLDPAPLPPIQPNNPLLTHTSEDMARLSETHNDLGPDQNEDEADTGKRSISSHRNFQYHLIDIIIIHLNLN